jgi:threonylcarbamoyladenosine tRNA methylthiotransferase MtaB
LTSYGVDNNKGSLLEVIVRLNQIEGLERIRLGSLEPRVITEEFAKTISSMKKVCPHFHLSLQSGCDKTLKQMNRKYTTQEYAQKCELLRKYLEAPAITTDVIVGFPGETEEDFSITKEYLEGIHFCEMHIFKYSRRKGTAADAMPDQIAEQVKAKRSAELIEMAKRMTLEYLNHFSSNRCDVLIEEKVSEGGKEYFTGYTKNYIRVMVPAEQFKENAEHINTVVDVQCIKADEKRLVLMGNLI